MPCRLAEICPEGGEGVVEGARITVDVWVIVGEDISAQRAAFIEIAVQQGLTFQSPVVPAVFGEETEADMVGNLDEVASLDTIVGEGVDGFDV